MLRCRSLMGFFITLNEAEAELRLFRNDVLHLAVEWQFQVGACMGPLCDEYEQLGM